MATVRETAHRHGQDVVAGNMASVMADLTPEALAGLQKFGKMPPQPTKTAEIVGEKKDGAQDIFDIKYSNDTESLTIRSWWEDQAGTWKIVRAEPVS